MAQDPSAESKGDESNKESESKVDNSKYFDIKKEDLGLQGVIDIVLVDIDDKTGSEVLNPDIKWTVYNTGDPKIQVVYRKMGGDVYTIRGRTEIAISIDEVYDFFDCSKTDEQEFSMEIDKLQTSWKVAHVYDDDHCVVHTTFDTGFPKWIIWPRDFCYMKRRIKFDKYPDPKDKNKSFRIAGDYSYSIDEKHPHYVETAKNHVRGLLHRFGYIFVEKSENLCTLYYVASIDPCGAIPTRVVNYSAPAQGMNVKGYSDNVDKIKQKLANRKKDEKK